MRRGGWGGGGGGESTFSDYGLLIFLHDELLEFFFVGVGEFGEVDVRVHCWWWMRGGEAGWEWGILIVLE